MTLSKFTLVTFDSCLNILDRCHHWEAWRRLRLLLKIMNVTARTAMFQPRMQCTVLYLTISLIGYENKRWALALWAEGPRRSLELFYQATKLIIIASPCAQLPVVPWQASCNSRVKSTQAPCYLKIHRSLYIVSHIINYINLNEYVSESMATI